MKMNDNTILRIKVPAHLYESVKAQLSLKEGYYDDIAGYTSVGSVTVNGVPFKEGDKVKIKSDGQETVVYDTLKKGDSVVVVTKSAKGIIGKWGEGFNDINDLEKQAVSETFIKEAKGKKMYGAGMEEVKGQKAAGASSDKPKASKPAAPKKESPAVPKDGMEKAEKKKMGLEELRSLAELLNNEIMKLEEKEKGAEEKAPVEEKKEADHAQEGQE